MNLDSVVDFPPLEACFKTPHAKEKSNDDCTPTAISSTLNPSAEVFTPRAIATIVNGCLESSTPVEIMESDVEMCGVASIGESGDRKALLDKSQNLSKRRSNKNRKYASDKTQKPLGGKRRLSMTSLQDTTVSSMDNSISDQIENENDPDVLARREKNIRYGKNTNAYESYIQLIPRQRRDKSSPRTPVKEMRYSRRQWDGLIKHWKLRLHNWDRDANGVPCGPSFSTPKRSKTKCDRRSMGNNVPFNGSPIRRSGNMLPPSIKIMLANENDKAPDTLQDVDQGSDVIDWSQPLSSKRVMDWSKECCESSEDEAELEVSKENENVDEKQPQNVDPKENETNKCTLQNVDPKENETNECTLKDESEKLSSETQISEEEGMVYTCSSLVEAIAAFDDATYNEEEDEDYLPPEERGLKLEEIGLDASDEDSDSEPESLFYRVVQRNQPFSHS